MVITQSLVGVVVTKYLINNISIEAFIPAALSKPGKEDTWRTATQPEGVDVEKT